jgi:hypothetical protein
MRAAARFPLQGHDFDEPVGQAPVVLEIRQELERLLLRRFDEAARADFPAGRHGP